MKILIAIVLVLATCVTTVAYSYTPYNANVEQLPHLETGCYMTWKEYNTFRELVERNALDEILIHEEFRNCLSPSPHPDWKERPAVPVDSSSIGLFSIPLGLLLYLGRKRKLANE